MVGWLSALPASVGVVRGCEGLAGEWLRGVGWLSALPAMAGVGLCNVTNPLHAWPIVSTPPITKVGGLACSC